MEHQTPVQFIVDERIFSKIQFTQLFKIFSELVTFQSILFFELFYCVVKYLESNF